MLRDGMVFLEQRFTATSVRRNHLRSFKWWYFPLKLLR